MFGTQNETGGEFGIRNSDCGLKKSAQRHGTHSVICNPQPGFTLTELLVVIAIIAVLASLITGAAINALNTAKQAGITLELQQLGTAMEDLKNELGVYPPNVFSSDNLNPRVNVDISNNDKSRSASQLLKFMKKSFPRSTEFQSTGPIQNQNIVQLARMGLSPAEALVFWLQGFSKDPARPLTGTDLVVTFLDNPTGAASNNVITIDSFQPRFDFDRGRLRISRNDDADQTRRFLTLVRADGTEVQVQLYEYLPTNSQEPYVYFDTSRESPSQVINNWDTTEFFYQSSRSSEDVIFPLKQLRADTPATLPAGATEMEFVEYVERDKFQIMHCGLDDVWGNFSNSGKGGELDVGQTQASNANAPNLLAPEGPFIGDIADTLGNFMTGTLEDKQE